MDLPAGQKPVSVKQPSRASPRAAVAGVAWLRRTSRADARPRAVLPLWVLLGLALACAVAAPRAVAESVGWTAALEVELRGGGHVLLVRHAATEPGLGDPPGFRLGDCGTQRNLSAAGRAQAQASGAALRARNIPVAEVRSSRWCRCLDTARLAFDGFAPVYPWPTLDSFFDDRAAGPARTPALLAAARAVPERANVVWVTHQVNITAFSGVVPAPGEIVVVRAQADGVVVVARLPAA